MTSDLTSALEVSHIMRYTNRRILPLLLLLNCFELGMFTIR